jgi:hypothetical protein
MSRLDGMSGREHRFLRVTTAVIAIGVGLFAFQVVGIFLEPKSNTFPGTVAGYHYATLPLSELESFMAEASNSSDEEWLTNAHRVVSDALAHGDAVRLHPAHSWTLWLAAAFSGDQLMATQDPQTIASAGSAICSQSARVLQSIASKAGLSTRFISFDGHVVLEVETEGRWLVADTDFGILYPFALEGLVDRRNTTLVRSLLSERGIESSAINGYLEIIHSGSEVRHPVGEPHEPIPERYEKVSIWLSWIIPVLLVVGGCLGRSFHDNSRLVQG